MGPRIDTDRTRILGVVRDGEDGRILYMRIECDYTDMGIEIKGKIEHPRLREASRGGVLVWNEESREGPEEGEEVPIFGRYRRTCQSTGMLLLRWNHERPGRHRSGGCCLIHVGKEGSPLDGMDDLGRDIPREPVSACGISFVADQLHAMVQNSGSLGGICQR